MDPNLDELMQIFSVESTVLISGAYCEWFYRGEGGGGETAAGPPVGRSGRPPAGTALHYRRANRQHQVGHDTTP
jgi:hypothetical protein